MHLRAEGQSSRSDLQPPKIARDQHHCHPQILPQAPICTSRVLSATGRHIYCPLIILTRKEGGKVQRPMLGLDRCKLPRGQGVTGLNWLQESSLPRESEDKQEKNTGEGQQQRQLLCGFCPRGCVQSLRPTDSPGASTVGWPGLTHRRTKPPFHLLQELE